MKDSTRQMYRDGERRINQRSVAILHDEERALLNRISGERDRLRRENKDQRALIVDLEQRIDRLERRLAIAERRSA